MSSAEGGRVVSAGRGELKEGEGGRHRLPSLGQRDKEGSVRDTTSAVAQESPSAANLSVSAATAPKEEDGDTHINNARLAGAHPFDAFADATGPLGQRRQPVAVLPCRRRRSLRKLE